MKKEYLIFLIILLVIGAILFFDQVLALFQGMSVLEAMQKILTFILHVVVVTIISYVAFTIPNIVKPWLRMIRRQQRTTRHRRRNPKQQPAGPIGAVSNKDRVLWWMMTQMANHPQSKRSSTAPVQAPDHNENESNHIRLNF